MSETVGVLAQPLARLAGRGRYFRALVWKANPRSEAYMRDLFAKEAPDGRVVDAEGDLAAALRSADRVLLLYPDAIGLGWEAIERAVRRATPAGATIEVLNGRRRRFALDPRTRGGLAFRRALERAMLVEALAAPVIIGLAPVLWAIDALRGRR